MVFAAPTTVSMWTSSRPTERPNVRGCSPTPGSSATALKVDAAIHNAQVIRALRDSHGGFADWLDAHALLDGALRDKPAWVKLFKKSFRFTGGEIVGEFLMSLGYLPGAHRETARHTSASQSSNRCGCDIVDRMRLDASGFEIGRL